MRDIRQLCIAAIEGLSCHKPATTGVDAVDGSSRRHLGANMVAVEATIERGTDHE